MANAHDKGYKLLFSTPELVRDLILGFVPDEWLHGLDYNTLERVPGSYITCHAGADGRPWYYDDDHLSEFDNRRLLPMFREVTAAAPR